jgi:aryl-alcohol dehydrogenase-like predicted oxidoreductase
MEYRALGRSGIKVSAIGLGTMTFGEQNTEAEGHAQLDLAFEHGVNLIDTAEVYAVPPRAETYGSTERIIGTWLKRRGGRDQVVLATKVAGPARGLAVNYLREGKTGLDRANILAAVESSLERLQTDYIDLYQLHWPDRSTNFFGRLGYQHSTEPTVPIEETLDVLAELVRAGKVRQIGVSNETPWGVHRYLQLADGPADNSNRPRIVSIQNPYNLLNRTFEIGLAEFALRDQVGLLAYSPTAFGTLSGKFLHGARPSQARVVRWSRFSRYAGPIAEAATTAYVDIAQRHGLEPIQMALAFVTQQPFVTSNLLGATTLEQLRTNLGSAEVQLTPAVLEDIEAVQRQRPNPCP